VTSKLQVQVADAEVTQEFSACNWSLLLSGGLGYADVTQNYNAFAVRASGAAAQPLFSGSSFTGLDPVIALEGHRQLFDTCLSLYGSTRTRLLFGNAEQVAFGGDELHGSQESRQRGLVAVEELELGLEVGRSLGGARVFGQVALVGQEWFGVGNATRSARAGPPTTIPNFSAEDNSNFGFSGVCFRVGITY
jgi:hypothetical protein